MTPPLSEHDVHLYRNSWSTVMGSIVAQSRLADRSIAYLHLPKTGGSSITVNFARSADWLVTRLPASHLEVGHCTCGAPGCQAHVDLESTRQLEHTPVPGRNLLVRVGHERFVGVEWVRSELASHGCRLDAVHAAVRPARKRLESMFTDYWTQARRDPASEPRPESSPIARERNLHHDQRVTDGYRADSVNYLDRRGRIDGRAWFSAFAKHGAGVTFMLHEVFDGSPGHLDDALSTGWLKPLRTADIDRFVQMETGTEEPRRLRVSAHEHRAEFDAAIASAADIIDEIASLDSEYDAILAKYLDAPEFRG